jgi:hypothetical protein
MNQDPNMHNASYPPQQPGGYAPYPPQQPPGYGSYPPQQPGGFGSYPPQAGISLNEIICMLYLYIYVDTGGAYGENQMPFQPPPMVPRPDFPKG